MAVTADEIRVIVRSEFDDALRDYKKLNKGLDDTNSKLQHSAAVAQKYGRTMTRYLTLPIAAAAAASVKFAADIEQQSVAFEVLIGDVQKGKKHFEELKQFSAKTPLQLQDIADASLTLQGFGTDAEDVVETLTMLGNAAQGQSSKLDRLVLAYGKLQAKGRATLEELNMFTEAGVPLMQQLSEQFGKSTEELYKMVSQGEVSFTDVQQAITDLTTEGGKFAGLLERMSQTTAGKASTALDNLKLSAAELGAELLPMVNDFLDGATELLRNFNDLDDSTKKLILTAAGLTAALGPITRAAGASITLVGKMRALGPIMTKLGPLLANPWGLAAAAIAGATIAIAGYRRAKRKAIEDDTRDYWAVAEHQIERVRLDWQDMIAEFFGGDLDFTGSTIEEYVEDFNEELERLGSKTRLSRDQVIQALADISRASEWEELKDVLKITDEDIVDLDDPATWLEDYIKKAQERLQGVLSSGPTGETKNSWQEWWAEVTGASGDVTGALGADLAAEYLAGVEREIEANRSVAIALGDYFDPTEIYEQKISELKETLISLLKIDPGEFDNPEDYFKLLDKESGKTDASIHALVNQIIEYETALERMRAAEERTKEIHEEYVLTMMGIDPASLEAERALTGLAETSEATGTKIQSMSDIAMKFFLGEEFDTEDFNDSLNAVAAKADSLVNAFFDIGEVLGEVGSGSAEARQQLRDMILDAGKSATAWALAAGLRELAAGNPAGWALLGLAGVTGIATAIASSHKISEMPDLSEIYDNTELQDAIQEEIDIRRENIRQLEDVFSREYDILRDQWQRGLITTEEFRKEAEDLGKQYTQDKESLDTEVEDAQAAKIAELQDEITYFRDAYNNMSDWQKFWGHEDEVAVENINELLGRIQDVQNADTVAEVEAAPQGADFITNGKQLLLVGDNPGGRERVSVEPISSRNMYGPSGGDTIVIQGNTFVGVGGVDQLIEMIETRKKTLQRTGRV